MAHNYILRVSAGPDYDPKTHKVVPVNSPTPVSLDSEHISVELNVRVQSYRGLPHNSPSTSPYFSLPPHDRNKDQYSIAFKFVPKKSINGNDLVFGNDFDHPIRDRLPPGFNTALKIVKWVADPGLDGDVYADQPYLYGPALSSVNVLHVGGKGEEGKTMGHDDEAGLVFEEGGDADGIELRTEMGVPEGESGRKKHFLIEENRQEWEWEAGRTYGCDFFNPYLDFNEFALRLPGFTLHIMKYWDGQGLRYVLKNRKTNTVLFVVLFTLYLKEDVDEHGNIKEGVVTGKPFEQLPKEIRERHEKEKSGMHFEEDHGTTGSASEKEEVAKFKGPETSEDDVD